jgi:hypothetical protein
MNIKNQIKDLILDQLMLMSNYLNLLQRGKYKKMSEVNFDHLVRWYPQICNEGRDSYGLDILKLVENHKISKAAIKSLSLAMEKNLTKDKLRKTIHYEHNVPVDLVRNKIIKLFNTNQFSKNDIKEILETEYEVILIAKSEESLLKKEKLTKKGSYNERILKGSIELANSDEKKLLYEKLKAYIR